MRRPMSARRLWAMAAAWLALAAADLPAKTKLACDDLHSLTGYEFTIISATVVPAAAETPEHCRVTGQVLPQVRFEVSLPASWNRKMIMFGNGGFAGSIPGRSPRRDSVLRQGFAVTATDTGHDGAIEPLASFAVDRQKLLDYAYRAVHVTALTAKRIAQAYYLDPLERSYFDGCSTGGRQGLMSAQRFPDDFDGIVVGAPVLNFTGTMISAAWNGKALLAGPIPTGKLKLLSEKVMAKCDGQDGLTDGLIDDPRRCAFQPARDLPACAADADGPDCFTVAQIKALEKIYGGVVRHGKQFFPGQPVGAEILAPGPKGARSGWDGWIVRDNAPTTAVMFSESFLRYMAFGRPDPSYDWRQLNFETDPDRMEWIHGVLDATDPNLSRFRARGSKILMYFGWADPALNPLMGIGYYQDVVERMGPSTTDFFRLFMVPGMFHCGGGVGPSNFDALSPLVQWVEKGVAPESIVGSRMVDGKAVRTRPLCPYPQVAKHQGGSMDDATSFACVAP